MRCRFSEQKLSMATFSRRRRCLNNPNVFCYICGEYTLQSNRKGISEFVKCAYLAYFKVMLGDQNKAWVPHIVCKQSVEHIRQWKKKDRKSLRFGISMVWREPKNHFDDCYFCAVNPKGINRKNRNSLVYPNFESAIRPIPHCNKIPVPAFKGLLELELKKTKPPFCPLAVVKPLFQMSVFLLLHYHSFFLKENLII